MKDSYLFSVIMPVHNAEEFLEDSLNSLFYQTINFQKNIQLIIINDGSTDKSEEICLKYQSQYPKNIRYIKQENKGVASARNCGIKYIEGKYVNFFDSDDIWAENAFELASAFLEKNPETDIAACRKKFFGSDKGYHGLDYKFSKTRVIDLNQNFEAIQTDVSSAFIRTEAIKNSFCESLEVSEDTRFINEILLEKCTLGVIREAEYSARKYKNNSPMKKKLSDQNYFFDTPKYFHEYLLDFSKEKYGEVKKFIQYTLMYDIQWRLKRPAYAQISPEDLRFYQKTITKILQDIEDKMIYRQKSIYMPLKMYALSMKHGKDVRRDIFFDENTQKLFYENFTAIDLNTAKTLLIFDYVEIRGDMLYLEGKDNCWLHNDDYYYYIQIGSMKFYPKYYSCKNFDLVTMTGIASPGRAVYFEIPLDMDNQQVLEFYFKFKKTNIKKIAYSLGKFSHIPKIENGYYHKGNFILKSQEFEMTVLPYSKELHQECEEAYQKTLLKENREDIILIRKEYFKRLANKRHQLWMVSDRPHKAGDNGEHFFKYLQKKKPRKTDVVFNLNQDSEDFERIRKIGKVISYDTQEYKLHFLLSDKIISSGASDYLFNAFGQDRKYLVDLYNFDFIFLQHGVTKDDISGWVNRFNKDIKMIVTSGENEYHSMIHGNYYYPKDVIVLTIMPRYDELIRLSRKIKKEKQIVIIPTWRMSIKGSYDPATSKSIYYEKFKETEYFQFYNSLINHEKLKQCMKEHGYHGILCMHPIHSEQWVDFDANEVFEINQEYVDYQPVFAKSALLVTDYSSVAFDFAYLKKPVIYAQFDKEKFFAAHSYKKGYFSYEENGFGPVCYDLESTVQAMIKEIENDCQNPEKYIQRAESFYPCFNGEACRRVLSCIEHIDS